ncbi:hypothetical protein B1992_11635 [Pseudoxanthomonas broegbernensis]|uniref:Flagellar hook-length control protein-like C-terminal domain-containing protein n=1 Tax=Pseudoxanthomonas broegbernensis TaxID=83619 RepID=A0A7V8GL71_9GAMM|nr:flagellar hook-length control protein FliK [Pseudoxanthomonas broegbernensis]KAF1685609.1 hypothetical protein B1992_11635 [Pseudoxanthomonas broegbernensis]MBB6065984.1 flagellar hook-length control protein FliK [Pseudoxanthomonas broegbernensis]
MSAIANAVAPAPAPPAPGASGVESAGDGQFSRMLQGGAQQEGTPRTDPANAGDTRPGKRADAAGRDAGHRAAARAPGAEDGEDADPAATAEAGETLRSADAAPDAETAPDNGWPPPGLASLLDPAAAPPPATGAAVAQEAPASSFAGAPSATGATAMPQGLPGAVPAAVAGTADAQAQTQPVADAPAADGARPLPAAAAATAAASTKALPVAEQGTASPAPADPLPVAAAASPAPTASTASTADASAATFVLPPVAPPPAAASAPPLSAPHAPVPQLHGQAFADDIGTHVQWLAGQKIGHAHIRISPQELGPVEIRLRLDGDRISADFTSAQPEVRQALESSLPRLREMLGQHGFQLAHAGVGQQSPQSQRDGNSQAAGTGTGGGHGDAAVGEETAAPPVHSVRRGLLDAYA